ncbi:type IV pilin protein [Vibrio sp. TBV020]|uniref:type IV pilin protein n=1 Tax=Vibrio sp. TBV020 TaxID=3137398 RepID=UPI0038CD6697
MTLLELMFVIAVISILASIAYPSYQSHVLKAHRIAAISDLVKVQVELERKYNGSYASAAQSVLSGGVCSFCEIDSGRFDITVSSAITSYTITATAKGTQTNDDCAGNPYTELTLNSIGENTPSECWK